MKHIMKRYILTTTLVVCLLFLINGVILYYWLRNSEDISPYEFSQLKKSITVTDSTYTIDEKSLSFIQNNYLWAMIIGDDGTIVYQYNLPEKINRDYSVGDIADFSEWYLEDYPVSTINSHYGVIVLGQEANSIWKKNLSIETHNLHIFIPAIIMVNLIVAALLFYIFSARFTNSLKTVIAGIMDLAHNKSITLSESGNLSNVCEAINLVSNKLSEQWSVIEKNNEMKTKWLAGVTHDIRTPLEIMVGNLEELAENVRDEKQLKQLILIRNQCFKIKTLLSDLNLIQVLETKSKYDAPQTINICKVIRDCIADTINMYDSPNYAYSFLHDDNTENIQIHADEHLLLRAFSNLLINSIVHNKNGCNITISLEQCEEGIQIRFSDDGIGITEEKQKDLCSITDNTQKSTHGWGIIVVKQIIEYHNGTIQFLPSKQGMQVIIYLPF